MSRTADAIGIAVHTGRQRRLTWRHSLLASVAVLAAGAMPALAQDAGVINLPGLVIEGLGPDLNAVPVDKVGSSVSIVTKDQIEASQARHVADILRTVPGLAVNRAGGPGGLTEVRVRGAEANHVLVLIDGVEANSTTDGSFDFSDLLVEEIERIEVVRGPQSGVWGSNALAGMINIVTASGRNETPKLTASAEAGGFGTQGFSAGMRGGSDIAWGAISVGGRQSSGFNVSNNGNENDGFRGTNVQFRGGMALGPNLTLEGFVRDMDKRVDIDGFGAAPGALPGDLAVATDQFGAETKGNTLVSGASLKLDLFDGHWQSRVYGNFNDTERQNIDPLFGNSSNDGTRRKVGATSTIKLDQPELAGTTHTLTALVEQETESFVESSSTIEHGREKTSVAADYRGEFFDQLFLGASVRRDDSDAFGVFDTYRLSAAWKLAQTGTRFHSSTGTGVVFPSMFEQFGVIPGFFTPNPNLKPETSTGWDAGIEQSLLGDKLVVDITYFDQNLESEIFSSFFGPPTNLIGESTRSGIEVTATMRPVSTIDIVASYTHLDARDDKGQDEVRRPEHAGSISANWHFADGKGLLSAGVIYNGQMQDVAFDAFTFAQQRVLLDAYTVVDIAASYEVAPQVQLFGRVENALNEKYQEVFGFNPAGVAAYGGLKITLGGDQPVAPAQ